MLHRRVRSKPQPRAISWYAVPGNVFVDLQLSRYCVRMLSAVHDAQEAYWGCRYARSPSRTSTGVMEGLHGP
jgi:hypothetical protein